MYQRRDSGLQRPCARDIPTARQTPSRPASWSLRARGTGGTGRHRGGAPSRRGVRRRPDRCRRGTSRAWLPRRMSSGSCVAVFRDAGYGEPVPARARELEVRLDLCLGPLGADERAIRHVSDDQAIAVGHACRGARAGYRPLEQALATDFARALERLRADRPSLGLGPDGKALVVVLARDWSACRCPFITRRARNGWLIDRSGARRMSTSGRRIRRRRRTGASGRRRLAGQRGGRVRNRRTIGRQRPQRQEAGGRRLRQLACPSAAEPFTARIR